MLTNAIITTIAATVIRRRRRQRILIRFTNHVSRMRPLVVYVLASAFGNMMTFDPKHTDFIYMDDDEKAASETWRWRALAFTVTRDLDRLQLCAVVHTTPSLAYNVNIDECFSC